MSPSPDLDKGGVAEEALRHYFQSLGSFVIRGVPLRESGELVSDIDLWVYTRVSAYARQISIVDIKNRKRARGFERILWVRGVQAAVGADEAIVATTDTRNELAPFAARLGVHLLTPQPLKAIVSRFAADNGRLTNEELYAIWRAMRRGGGETIQARIEAALNHLARGISFPTLNSWIDDAVVFLRAANEIEPSPGAYSRAAYFSLALIAMGADYLGRDLAFADAETRRLNFQQGLLFGSSAAALGRDMLGFTEAAVTEFLDPTGSSASTIRRGFEDKIAALPVGSLVDFFTRPAAGRELLDGAVALEAAAFARDVPAARELKPEAKALIGAVLDYGGISRAPLLGTRSVKLSAKSEQQSLPLDKLEPVENQSSSPEPKTNDDGAHGDKSAKS